MYKQFRMIYLLLFVFVSVVTACSPPNNTPQAKPSFNSNSFVNDLNALNKNTLDKLNSKNFKTKGIYDNYFSVNNISLVYTRTTKIDTYRTYGLNQGYSAACLDSTVEEPIVITSGPGLNFNYNGNQWVIDFYGKNFYLPAQGGSFQYNEILGAETSLVLKRDFNVSLSIANNKITISVKGSQTQTAFNSSNGTRNVSGSDVCPSPPDAGYLYISWQVITKEETDTTKEFDLIIPEPTPTPTNEPSPTPTPSPTVTPTPTPTPSPSPSPCPSIILPGEKPCCPEGAVCGILVTPKPSPQNTPDPSSNPSSSSSPDPSNPPSPTPVPTPNVNPTPTTQPTPSSKPEKERKNFIMRIELVKGFGIQAQNNIKNYKIGKCTNEDGGVKLNLKFNGIDADYLPLSGAVGRIKDSSGRSVYVFSEQFNPFREGNGYHYDESARRIEIERLWDGISNDGIYKGKYVPDGVYTAEFHYGVLYYPNEPYPIAGKIPEDQRDGVSFNVENIDTGIPNFNQLELEEQFSADKTKHLEGTKKYDNWVKESVKDVIKGRNTFATVQVFTNVPMMSYVTQQIAEKGETSTCSRKGEVRYTLLFSNPVGYNIYFDINSNEVKREFIYYGEVKVKNGQYHAVPRVRPAT